MTKIITAEEILLKVKLGMTREEVKAALGEPTDISIGSRKYPRPCVWKYGDIELHFEYPIDGGLWMVYTETDDGQIPHVLLGGKNSLLGLTEQQRRCLTDVDKLRNAVRDFERLLVKQLHELTEQDLLLLAGTVNHVVAALKGNISFVKKSRLVPTLNLNVS